MTTEKRGYIKGLLGKASAIEGALKAGKNATDKAAQTGKEMTGAVMGKAKEMQKHGEKTVGQSIAAAKNATDKAAQTGKEMTGTVMGKAKEMQKHGEKTVGQSIAAAKTITGIAERDLNTLERLHDLQKNGIITDEEFQVQKRKILDRI